MILKVNKDSCEIKENEIWNVGDYNVHTVNVELSSDFNGLVNKVRYFVEDNCYDELIVNNIAQVPYEATLTEGTIKIGVYGFDADTNILVQSTAPVNKFITSGTYTGNADNTEPLTPTDKQQMESAIQQNTDDITDLKANKQDKLISGVNIKTINNESILSSGNLTLVAEETDPIFTNSPAYSITDNDITYWNNKANMSDIPDVSNFITKDVDDLTYYTKSTDMQNAIDSAVNIEKTARENADVNLQNQIDTITVSSDVVDVVSTYQDLVDYDTQHIKANDIIKVMQDSTHDNAISYYRWVIVNHVGSWVYVGSEGPYYTKSETDTLLNAKQNTITTTNKLQSDLIDDTNQTNLFVTSTEKTTWNNKLDQSDLNDYVKNTDYASSSTGGVIKTVENNGFAVSSAGNLYAVTRTFSTYSSDGDSLAISKGTLENVITGKNLETANNKVTSISASSTDVQYPSAKCVHDSQATQDDEIEALQTENERLKATLPTTTGEGQDITLDKTAEMEFVKPPLPRGNTKQNTTTGKNLLNTSNANTTTLNGVTSYRSNGVYYLSGTNTKTDATWILPNTQNTNLPVFEIGQTYTMSFKGTMPNGIYAQLNAVSASTGTQYSIGSVRNTVPSITFTIDSNYSSTAQLFVGILGATTNVDCNFAIQIEKGPTATSYEPYTGGQPSPNPDYPQEVEVVTGNVEVTISNNDNLESKTLPVSLGNIELCKLGNYQDYLYKNNGKWYVHKNTIKIDLSTITSYTHTSGWRNPTAFVADGVFNHGYSGYTTVASLFCNRLIADTPARVTGSVINAIGLGRNSSIYLSVEGITTSNALITYFSQNPTYLYAPLATPTDTEITDTTLISQLEEISKTLSYQGQTNITSNTIALFDVEAYQSTKLILQNIDSRLTLVEG